MSRKNRTQSKLIAKTLPKNLVRAQVAGEINANLGGDETSTRIAQEGFASRVWKTLEVYGVDKTGRAREMVRLNVDRHEDGNDHISIAADDSRSMIERLDGGYGKGVALTKKRFDSKGLRAETRFRFTDEIERDPVRKRAEQERLGTQTYDPPDWAPGYTCNRAGKLTPGRDPGQSMEFFRGRKNRS